MMHSSDARLDAILRTALRTRLVEEFINAELPRGRIRCPVHLSLGQELPSAVIAHVMPAGTRYLSTHRCHAHYLAAGGDLTAMFGELLGKSGGCCRGWGGSMHLADHAVRFRGSSAIVGGSWAIGIGMALASQRTGGGWPTVVYGGDGACEEGAFWESASFAALHHLPILMIVEDNDRATYTPRASRRVWARLDFIASGLGIAYHLLAPDTIEGTSPILSGIPPPWIIECPVVRACPHVGPTLATPPTYPPLDLIEEYRTTHAPACDAVAQEIKTAWDAALTMEDAAWR